VPSQSAPAPFEGTHSCARARVVVVQFRIVGAGRMTGSCHFIVHRSSAATHPIRCLYMAVVKASLPQ
jgi:hypothetical protein